MIYEKRFQAYGFDSIVAYNGSDISEKMINECLKIDVDFYDEEYYLDSTQLKRTILECSEFCFVYFDREDGKVIGYTFWFPVKTKVFNAFIREKKMLLEIRPEFCAKLENVDKVNLFIAGEAFVVGYNVRQMHSAIEDLLQKKILSLAKDGIKVKYIAMESCCKYDEDFLLPKLNLSKSIKKDKSTFYYDIYSPEKCYKDSKYIKEIKSFYE